MNLTNNRNRGRLFKGLTAAAMAVGLLSSASDGHASELASAWAEEEQTAVRIIAARDALGPDGTIRAGFEFKMKPGWKVYWRSPGDAGFPPIPEYDGSTNASVSDMSWPVPSRFSVLGLETLGYEDQVVLPFTLKADNPERTSWLAATVRYLTCNDICIPYQADLEISVPPGEGAPTETAHTISRFESKVPRSADAARLNVTELWTETSEKALYLVASATSEIPFKQPDLYLEGPRDLGFGPPELTYSDDGMQATMRVAVSGYEGAPADAAKSITGTPFILTLSDGQRAAEINADADAPRALGTRGSSSSSPAPSAVSLPLMLLFAFLGGLILNLMPCVLPVLSIKFLSLVKHGGSAPAEARHSFLASAAGIIFAFMILAAALISLKSAGAGIGWGIQFQQPWFLIGMALLVTLFACNLWGFFEVRLPGAIADASQRGSSRNGLAGNFLQGMFATLLATPCSAPFLGTAVGFALARGATEILAIFAVLGLGLAAPYLAVAAFPRVATMMPKPGPWMKKLKIILGLALAATAVWLLTVVAGVVGVMHAALVAVILTGMCVWLGPVMRMVPEIKKATPAVLLIATLASVTGAYVGDSDTRVDPTTAAVSKVSWKPFDRETLNRFTDQGKIVFVDVTADWCITCLVNKRLVLEKGRMLELLNGPDVIPMQADWTRPDPEIAAYLASFDRYGIPFNAVYGPNAKTGVALPELLTESNVLEGFRTVVPAQLASAFEE